MLNKLESNDGVLLVGRILIALIYASAAVGLLSGKVPVEFAANGAKFFALPAFIVWIGYSIKVVAGVCIIIGFQTRLSALALSVFTLITAFNYHDIGGTIFMKEMTMLGGLLVLAAAGPGRFSLDKR